MTYLRQVCPILIILFLNACISSSKVQPQTVGNCFGTTATRIRILAGSNLRFPIPVESIGGASAKVRLGQASLKSASPWVQAAVRTGRDLVGPKRPGVFFIDLYSTVDAAPGEIGLSLPIEADPGQGGGCVAAGAVWRFAVEVMSPRRLPQKELEMAGTQLTRPLDTYTHREFVARTDAQQRRRFSLVRFEEIQANLRLRSEASLPATGERYSADEQGNIGRFGNLSGGRGWAPLRYGLVFFAVGGSMMAIDASGDGVIDLALGGRRAPAGLYGRWWIETNAFGEGFFECWAARREWIPELRNEVEAAVGGGTRGPCAGGGSGGGSTGVLGGPFGLPGGGLLGPPDCSFTPSLLGQVSDEGPTLDELVGPEQTDEEFAEMIDDIRREMEREVVAAEREAVERRREEQVNSALLQAPPEPAEENVLDNVGRAIERSLIIHEAESTRFRGEPSIRNCEGVCPGLIFEGSWGRGGGDTPRRNGTLHQPPIGPDGTPATDFQDPRCAGIITDAARGTLFTNPHFCGGSTLLECLLRQEGGAIYSITGGNCWREVGPDDASQLVCDDNGEFFPDCTGGREGEFCDDRCRPGDLLCRNLAPHGTAPPFLSTSPIGGILETICHADCPGIPDH